MGYAMMDNERKMQMRIRPKQIITGLAVIAACCMSSGCASQQQTEELTSHSTSEYEKHLDISIAYWNVESALAQDDEVLRKIEDKFNITFVPVNITWDDYYSRIRLWADTEALPDIFVGAYRTEPSFYKWIQEGLLHEIPEDLSDYPHLAQYMNSPERETCKINGKTYCIFRQTYSEQAETIKDRTILYRWDLAQKAGITKEPQNWDEFRQMIQAIIAADSEHTGITGMTAKGYNMLLGPLFTYSIPMASGGGTGFYWVEQEDGYVPALLAGETLGSDALATWKLIRDMYQEGTIEQDIILTTTSQAENKFLSGQSAAICIDGGISNTKTYENIGAYWKDMHGTEFLDDVKYLKPMPGVDGQEFYTVWDYAWSESYINASVDDEKFDRILALYDYLLSEEGVLLGNFGIEGKSYRKEATGEITLLTEQGTPTQRYPSTDLFSSLVCWNYGNLSPYRFPKTVPEAYVLEDVERVDMARKMEIPAYDYECTRIFYELGTDFSFDINNIFQRIMTGTQPVEEVWEEIIQEYKNNGLMEVIDKVNEVRKEKSPKE